MVGKLGRVSGTVQPGFLGEVMVPIRGGVEAFHARSESGQETFAIGDRVRVVEYNPPRSVVVAALEGADS